MFSSVFFSIFRGRNVLRIDGSSGPEELEFLSENDTGPTALFSDNSSASASASESQDLANAISSSENEMKAEMKSTAVGVTDPMQVEVEVGNSIATANAANSEGVVSLDDKLSQLQALGFTLAESQLALTQADGEVNLAATLLFSSR